MTLTAALRDANPVPTPSDLSERGRAELAALLGTDAVPAPQPPSPTRRARRWAVLGLAGALVAAVGLTLGVVLPGNRTTVLPVWAQPIVAPVVAGTTTPVPYGVSVTFDVPFPDELGVPGLHLVMRLWISNPDTAWRDTPRTITFVPRAAQDGWAAYVAADWPLPEGMGLILGGASACYGSDAILERIGFTGPTWVHCPAGDPTAYDTAWAAPDGAMGLGDSTIVTAHSVTTDTAAAIDLLRQYELGPDGAWTATPPEGPAPQSPPRPDQIVPGTRVLKAGSYGASRRNPDLIVTIRVADDGQCTIEGDAAFATEAGYTRNPDGTCSYNP